MNINLTSQIFKDLKDYLINNSEYNPNVVKKALTQSDKYPLVTFVEANNSFSSGTLKFKQREIVDLLFWEINIYATDKFIDDKTVSNAQICEELKFLVDNVMSGKYMLKRESCRPTPNLDETIYRITMRYSSKLLTNKNRII